MKCCMKSKAALLLETLSDTARKLQRHVDHLEQQHLQLRVEEHVLASCCELLGWLRQGIKVHPEWLGTTQSWLPQELSLLQQLGMASGSEGDSTSNQQQHAPQRELHSASWAPLHACSDTATAGTASQPPTPGSAGSTPAATGIISRDSSMAAGTAGSAAPPAPGSQVYLTGAGDYLGGFRLSLSQQPDQTARGMSLEAFAQYYTQLVKELALLINLAEQQGRAEDLCKGMQHPLIMLQQMELRHLHKINTILLLHPDDLLNRLRVVNIDTLELSDTPEQAWDRMCWVADNIGLTPEQEATLIAGSILFSRLVDRVRAERQALSAQQGAQSEQRLATGRALDLEGQEAGAQRLSVLVKKECFLQACASMFTGGVLTVVQNAKVAVQSWPYMPHLGLLGSVLVARTQQAQAPRRANGGSQRSSKGQERAQTAVR